MIVNFSIENFGSIKDKQTLSFEATKSSHLENQYVVNTGGVKLLKLALIYGANASGKTTILKALDFLRNIVLEPVGKKTKELDFHPFLFDSQTSKQNSTITITFIQNEIRYYYEVEFSQKAIITEKLDFFHPNKAGIFKRKTSLENQFTEISFGSKIKIDKTSEKILESNTLWNNTVLGGFLKTNIELKELKEATDWFKQYLKPLVLTTTDLEGYVTSHIDKSNISKENVVNILKKADFNISDIFIQEEERDIPEGFITFIENQLNAPNDTINELKAKGRMTSRKLTFEHTTEDNKKYTLLFDLESQGTKRYYGFAGILALLIKNSVVFPIDELESSLHPELYRHFLLSFLLNADKSQIIATTHNREILDSRDILRDDAIWITDKDESCSTSLYSLADFDSSVIRDTTNRLNVYKSGKLGGVPHLGDYYIDIEK
ncbi:ATP/GTP-binding protein [Chitinophaga sp. RCC_12]|uniref:AAA family ATPase n=1 Tax=Chitinophaga sp. RCC_12 TaxID=3239226 RepID=UPI003525712E